MNNPICAKDLCTGCGACYNICPVQCIEMKVDEEGFNYPIIEIEKCIDCRKCRDVCPMINSAKFYYETEPTVYACWNKDAYTRYNSSSGGVFTVLADNIIDDGGVVFGAAYDDFMTVRHIAIDNKNDVRKLQGSKYVQSDISRTYLDIKTILSGGKKVLFSGTPCQIAGLKNFIGYTDENLITCDILCKGVPSPGLFNKYINFMNIKSKKNINHINFREKKYGWGIAVTQFETKDGTKKYAKKVDDSFMYSFSTAISIRTSCKNCQYTKTYRVGDITLGDFWGIGQNKEFKPITKNGISFVKINSKKGSKIFDIISTNIEFEKRTLDEALKGQGSALSKPIVLNKKREAFFRDYTHLNYEELSKKYLKEKGIKGLTKKIIPDVWIYKIRKIIRG